MLYEVITSSLVGKSSISFFVKQLGSTQITASSVDGRKITEVTTFLQVGKNTRITSYNVCYTKLLRFLSAIILN